jgi:hypothetical protein
VNGLNESLMGLRSTCIRSFPEVFVDVMRAAQPPAGIGGEGRDVGTSVAGITLSVCLISFNPLLPISPPYIIHICPIFFSSLFRSFALSSSPSSRGAN